MTVSVFVRIASVIAICLAAPGLRGQVRDTGMLTTPTGSGVISGVVVADDARGAPLAHVTVALSSGGAQLPRSTMTDDAGRFVFPGLAPGNYTLVASRPAYVTAYYGAKKPGIGPGVAIAVLNGQTVPDVTIRMLHGSVITGVIRNASGEPAAGLAIQVVPLRLVDGERKISLNPLATIVALSGSGLGAGGFGSAADDRGVYRVFGLSPGDYLVLAQPTTTLGGGSQEARQVLPSEVQWARDVAAPAAPSPTPPRQPAAPSPGPLVSYAPVYYPGTIDIAQATIVTLTANEERSGVDFTTPLVATGRISGTVLDPQGQPFPGAQLTLRASGSDAADLFSMLVGGANVRSGRDGSFSIGSVTPGRYTLAVRATPRQDGQASGRALVEGVAAPDFQTQLSMFGGGGTSDVFWAAEDLEINGRDVSNLTLALQPGLTISGRFAFEGSTRPPVDLTTARVTVGPAASNAASPLSMAMAMLSVMTPATTSQDGTFLVKGIAPGRYRLTVSMPGMILGASGPATGWALKSVTAGTNGDIADRNVELRPGENLAGLVVTMTDRPSEISGMVRDRVSRPAPEFPIIVFSTDRSYWTTSSRRVQQVRPVSDGSYRIVGLPAGEYFFAAVTDIDLNQLSDPAFLELLSAASLRISIADGEKKTQDLRLGTE